MTGSPWRTIRGMTPGRRRARCSRPWRPQRVVGGVPAPMTTEDSTRSSLLRAKPSHGAILDADLVLEQGDDLIVMRGHDEGRSVLRDGLTQRGHDDGRRRAIE